MHTLKPQWTQGSPATCLHTGPSSSSGSFEERLLSIYHEQVVRQHYQPPQCAPFCIVPSCQQMYPVHCKRNVRDALVCWTMLLWSRGTSHWLHAPATSNKETFGSTCWWKYSLLCKTMAVRTCYCGAAQPVSEGGRLHQLKQEKLKKNSHFAKLTLRW